MPLMSVDRTIVGLNRSGYVVVTGSRAKVVSAAASAEMEPVWWGNSSIGEVNIQASIAS